LYRLGDGGNQAREIVPGEVERQVRPLQNCVAEGRLDEAVNGLDIRLDVGKRAADSRNTGALRASSISNCMRDSGVLISWETALDMSL